jgi:hypothetical protein
LTKVLDEIAKTGDASAYDWKNLRNYIIIITRDVLINMQASFPDI